MTRPYFKKTVIAGCGLIGGSLALAGKKSGVFGEVTGIGRSESTLKLARDLGVIDNYQTDPKTALKGASLLFVSTPVSSIAPLILSLAPHMPDGLIVTDGGSVKSDIVKTLETSLPAHVKFIGGHPVAGTEKSGPKAAFDTLYEGRYTILTPTKNSDKKALSEVKGMWRAVGAKVCEMSPAEHDEALAVISHLPHLVAYALVNSLGEEDTCNETRKFVAGGFKSVTRIAASDPEMWNDIFTMNREATLKAVTLFRNHLEKFEQAIANNDSAELLEMLKRVQLLKLDMDKSE